jgi:hypothetical protein
VERIIEGTANLQAQWDQQLLQQRATGAVRGQARPEQAKKSEDA